MKSIKSKAVCILHRGENFGAHSGMSPLAEALGAKELVYQESWRRLQKHSWTLGQLLRRWGNWYYGSEWNALIPFWNEWRWARKIKENEERILHFLWGEFATPRYASWFRRKGYRLIGTFHCSARRQPHVLGRYHLCSSFDWITTMSSTQNAYLVKAGCSEERITTIPHGVDTVFFRPDLTRRWDPRAKAPLRVLLVGSTERDHECMSKIAHALPSDSIRVRVLTHPTYHEYYRNAACVELLSPVGDEALLQEYQQADLLLQPLLDCTANNAILEAMACGTPIMVNQVGGISEYVDSACNYILPHKDVDQWVSLLVEWSCHREQVWGRRPLVRSWAERFSWQAVASQYQRIYDKLLAEDF
jgi:glycosyltransferase involved in cell wall biosynthesis